MVPGPVAETVEPVAAAAPVGSATDEPPTRTPIARIVARLDPSSPPAAVWILTATSARPAPPLHDRPRFTRSATGARNPADARNVRGTVTGRRALVLSGGSSSGAGRPTVSRSCVTALRLPTEPPLSKGSCTLEERHPGVVLLDLGSELRSVAPPTDSCRKIRPEVVDAYAALRWTEVSRTRVLRLRSQSALAAGCDLGEDIYFFYAQIRRAGGSGGVEAPAGPVRVCRYRSTYPPGWTAEAQVSVDAEPLSGYTANPRQAAEIAAAVNAAGPAPDCTLRHTGFAVVALGTEEVVVELDGCLRILAPDGTLRQGDRGLVTLLAAGSAAARAAAPARGPATASRSPSSCPIRSRRWVTVFTWMCRRSAVRARLVAAGEVGLQRRRPAPSRAGRRSAARARGRRRGTR